MSRFDKPLDNPINWSFSVGRLFGIRIRVHFVFVLCAVALVWMQIPKEGSGQEWSLGQVLLDALGLYAILFFVVLTHEFGHCFGARFAGGDAEEILLWPLGGLASVNPPHTPSANLITAVAGPMVNVVFCTVSAVILILWVGSFGAVPFNPLHPMWPIGETIVPTTAQLWLMRFFGLSYILLLFNLLPIYPFDGGRVAQAWLWKKKGFESSMLISTATGMVGAIALGLFGLFTGSGWLLMMIAVFGYLTCYNMRRQIREQGMAGVGAFGYDFSQGYTSFDGEEKEKPPGFFERRRHAKVAKKAQQAREREERHAKQVEQALRKVSLSGLESLTPRERQVLDQESKRQRSLRSEPKTADGG